MSDSEIIASGKEVEGESDKFEDCETGSFEIVNNDSECLFPETSIGQHISGSELNRIEDDSTPDVKELMKKTVKVVNATRKNLNVLRTFVAMDKNGGGEVEAEYYAPKEGIVYFIFEDPKAAINMLKNGECKIMNHIFKFEPPEIVEYLSINQSRSQQKLDLKQIPKGKNSKKNSKSGKSSITKYQADYEGISNNDDNTCDARSEDETPQRIRDSDEEQIYFHADDDANSHIDPTDLCSGLQFQHESFKPEDSQMNHPNIEDVSLCADFSIAAGNQMRSEGELSSSKNVNSIIIYGVPQEDFVEDALIFRLEHKRQGGGKVNDVGEYDARQRKVKVTFQDSKVAHHFVERKILKVQNHDVFIFSMEIELALKRTILVTNVVDDEDKDHSMIFLESQRKGGGKIEWDKFDHNSKELWVRFANQSVADNFKNVKKLKILSKEIEFKEASILILIDIDMSSRIVFVGGVSEEIHQDVVEVLESDRHGGPIMHYRILDEQILEVVFFSESVSQKILNMKAVMIMQKRFPVAASFVDVHEKQNESSCHDVNFHDKVTEKYTKDFEVMEPTQLEMKEEDVDGVCKTPEFPELSKSSIPDTELNDESILTSNMKLVQLSNIKEIKSTETLLKLLLKNMRLKAKVKYCNEVDREAVIEFDDSRDALKFCEKKYDLFETACTLEVNPGGFESLAILVKCPTGIDKQFLSLYFENRSKSGGGNVRECGARSEGEYYVVFESLQDAHSVLNRKHVLDKKEISVLPLNAQPPPTHVKEEFVDKIHLLVSNLEPTIDRKYFIEIVEKIGKTNVDELVEGRKMVLLVFHSQPDYYALRKYTSCYPIKGYMVMLQRVAYSKQIQMALPLDCDIESIEKCLDELIPGNDKGIVDVNNENGLAIMTFKNHQTVQKILSSNLVIDNLKIMAKPYFQQLQGDVVKPVVPAEAKIFHKAEDLTFILRHPIIQNEIEASLRQHFPIKISWKASSGEIVLKLSPEEHDVLYNWGKLAETKLKELLKPFYWRERTCLKDLWHEVTNQVKQYIELTRHLEDNLEIQYDEDAQFIKFIGMSTQCIVLGESIDGIINKILLKKEIVTENIKFSSKQVALIKKMDDLLEAENEVSFTFSEECLTLKGPSELVENVRLKIYKEVNNFVSEEFDVEHVTQKFMEKESIVKHFDGILKENGAFASFIPHENQILVMAKCEQSLNKARNLFSSTIKKGHIKINPEQYVVIKLEVWSTFVIDLQAKLEKFTIQQEGTDSLSYICVENLEEELVGSVNKFLDENSIAEKFVVLQSGVLQGLKKFCSEGLNEIDDTLKTQGGQIVEINNPNDQFGFLLIGKKSELDWNVKRLEELRNKMSVEKVTLKKPNITRFFESKDFKNFTNNLETNYKVVISIYSKEVDSSNNEKFHEFLLIDKFKIIATLEDVASIEVDGIVSISSDELDPGSQTIFKLGGDKMISAAKEELQFSDNKHLQVLQNVGILPCKLIYHVVILRSEVEGDPELFMCKLHAVLEDANKNNFFSISILCPNLRDVGSGSYLRMLVPSLASFIQQSSGSLEKIIISCEDANALKLCESLLSECKNREIREEVINEELVEVIPSNNLLDEQFVVIDPNSVPQIEVIKGSIINVQADVIINSTCKELDLKRGQVSSCLLAAAGSEIQDECLKKKSKHFDFGDIVSTKGYKLKCKKVYHTSCVLWKGPESGVYISKIIKSALMKASKSSYKSIAFPALGTGNLRAPPKDVAKLMFQESVSFLAANKNTSIQKVYFVVYEKDLPTVKAFEECWRSFNSKVGIESNNTAIKHGNKETFADHSGGLDYAGTFAIDASDPYKLVLNDLEVEVVEGDLTSFPADAIVNSTNHRLDLSGVVSKAIVKKGGKSVMEELQTAKMKPTGVCVTKAGDLPANYIIHVVAQKNINDWTEVIHEALKEANVYGCNSIAFPVLGTGNFKQPVDQIAHVMIESFNKFSSSSSNKNLKKIFVCVYLKEVLDGFINGIKKLDHNQSRVSKVLSSLKEGVMAVKNFFIPKEQMHKELLEIPAIDHSIKTFEVSGLVPENITVVIEKIQKFVGDQFCEKALESERDKNLIGKMKKSQISELKGLKEKHKVDIKVDIRESSRKIVVSGFQKNLNEALKDVMKILIKVEEEEKERVEAEILEKEIMWEYQDTDGIFKRYNSKINLFLERAYVGGHKTSSWRDCSTIVSADFAMMKENRNDRRIDIRRVKAGFGLPRNWSSVPESQKYSTVTLSPTDQEFLDVQKNVMSTSQNSFNTIHKIERIQNPTLYNLYQTKKDAMEKSLSGKQVERTLWHGTSANVLHQINESGFNRSYCGKNATCYGRGVYFAKNFCYSAHPTYSPLNANGVKNIYQCKVLVGEFTNGLQTFIAPPAKPNSQDHYDSVVNNAASPQIFVVFYDNQAYPEYLVHFS